MATDLRQLGLGLIIGVAVAAMAIAAAIFIPGSTAAPRGAASSTINPSDTATQTPAPTQTFTPTPTFVKLHTATPLTPTPTLDPIEAAIQARDLVFSGPLSNQQQIELYKAALSYARTNVQDSLAEAKTLNGFGYDGDPSNICGPLVIAILQKARLLDTVVTPHDFWLLNPRQAEDQEILDRTFPSEKFLHTVFAQPINKIDWHSSPLQPGDFLFIWHGSWGNFDHMLVVDRIDKDLRAYAVTNFGTPDGFLISETMLYDPNNPTAGIFHTWTKERDAILGSTGFGGFELWRKRIPLR